jgi:hypothetical protein
MYLTAQRVVRMADGAEAINAFFYRHHVVWEGPPPEEYVINPGYLVNQTVNIEPPGNRVRSYLDITCPDGATWQELRQNFQTFVGMSQLRHLPWSGVVGRCLFTIGMDAGTARTWQLEVANLYRAVQAVATPAQ